MIMPFQFQGIILVYDITTEDSFKHISQWLQNIQDVSKIFLHLLLVPFFFVYQSKHLDIKFPLMVTSLYRVPLHNTQDSLSLCDQCLPINTFHPFPNLGTWPLTNTIRCYSLLWPVGPFVRQSNICVLQQLLDLHSKYFLKSTEI